ncbi:MAG: c-type cytochrome [Rhodospirillaceae bacterium]
MSGIVRAFAGFATAAFTAVFLLALSADAQAQTAGASRERGDMWNPHWIQRQIWGPRDLEPELRPRMTRHWTFMHQGIPEEYLRAENPFPETAETIAAGRVLYARACASCHGAAGGGDGEAARSLSPSPALLAYLIQRPDTVDSYLLWSISEGGAAFDTDMPSFKADMPKDDIWRIVAFMRAGFPAVEANVGK